MKSKAPRPKWRDFPARCVAEIVPPAPGLKAGAVGARSGKGSHQNQRLTDRSTFDRMKEFAGRIKLVYVATSNRDGLPHIAVSEGMIFVNDSHLFFKAWFCRKTIENLAENPKLSVVAFDAGSREGYQLLGQLERMEQGAVLNGFSPEMEKQWATYPQSEHQLLIRIDAVSLLTSGPHSDDLLP
jgi:uncharacterized protein